jgi:hypothetical protein
MWPKVLENWVTCQYCGEQFPQGHKKIWRIGYYDERSPHAQCSDCRRDELVLKVRKVWGRK